jgi:Xaa-Pro aminopeptidase
MVFVPAPELEARHERLRRVVASTGLDGALLHGVTSLVYFAGTAQQAHLWVPREGPPALLVRRVLARARAESALERVELLGSLKELAGRLGGARRVGMELDLMPVSLFERYRAVLPGLEAADVGPATRSIRAVKSPWELERIRASSLAADAVVREVRGALREGMSELELSIVAEGAERRAGFQGMLRWRAATGFECPWVHVLAGDSALAFSFADTPFGGEGVTPAAPYGASHRPIGRGVPVCLDFALARDGYIHDLTRTLSVGPLPDRLRRAHDVCVAVLDAVRGGARPGVTGDELWRRSLEVVEAAGLADHFMGWGEDRARFVGHGVGLELDELPVLAPRQTAPLEPGHVIAVEPKLFFPGEGAVGVESTLAIHPDRVETLTVTPEELMVV